MTASASPLRAMLARAMTHALVGLEPRGSRSRRTCSRASRASRSSGSPTARARRRSIGCGAVSSRPRSSGRSTAASPSTSRPAALRKEGSGFDLPISLAVLGATRQLPPERLAEHAAVGELALDGRIRPVPGTLAVAEGACRAGLTRSSARLESAPEAALAGIEPVPFAHLHEVVQYFRGQIAAPALRAARGRAISHAGRCRTSPRCGARNGRVGRSRSPPPARTTSFSWAHRERARRCSRGGCRDPAATHAREALEVTRIHSVVRAASARARARLRTAVSRTASRRLRAGNRRRRPEPAARRGLARTSGRAAHGRAARVPALGARSRCGSRSRTASSRSRVSAATRSSPRASSSSGR